MTAVPTDRIPCPARKKTTHAPTLLTGHCAPDSPTHDHCPGQITNGCGCVILCSCQEPNHRHAHAYEETPVLPDPFTVPDPSTLLHGRQTATCGCQLDGAALIQPCAKHTSLTALGAVSVDPSDEGPEVATPELHSVVTDWTDRIEPRSRPWIEGTGEPGTLEVMVRCFAMAAGDLHLHSDRYEAYDETALAALLGILRASVRRAQVLDALLVKHMWDHHPHGKHLLPALGEVHTHRRDAKVHWDTYGTAEAVVEAKLAERDGELPDDPMEPVRWVLEAGAIDYYRKTSLRALGLDPQDYYTREKGTLAVDVPVPD